MSKDPLSYYVVIDDKPAKLDRRFHKKGIAIPSGENEPVQCYGLSRYGKSRAQTVAERTNKFRHTVKGSLLDEWPILKPLLDAKYILVVGIPQPHDQAKKAKREKVSAAD